MTLSALSPALSPPGRGGQQPSLPTGERVGEREWIVQARRPALSPPGIGGQQLSLPSGERVGEREWIVQARRRIAAAFTS